MKWLTSLVMLVLVPALAGAQQATKLPDGITKADVQALNDAVAALGSAVPPSEAGETDEKLRERHAVVAGALMEFGSSAVMPLMTQVKQASPEFWGMLVRQQYSKAAEGLIAPLGIFIFSWVLWGIVGPLRRRAWDPIVKDQEVTGFVNKVVGLGGGYALPLIFMFDCLQRLLVQLSGFVGYALNPEYYAFRDLLVMILRQS